MPSFEDTIFLVFSIHLRESYFRGIKSFLAHLFHEKGVKFFKSGLFLLRVFDNYDSRDDDDQSPEPA